MSKLTILVAEDDDISFELISIDMTSISQKIIRAKTGFDAVDLCRNNPDIDVILMDIQMPELDGYAATQMIRKFNPTIPIIAQTSYGLSGDREKALEAGCNDYIAKPVNKTDLFTILEKYLIK